MSDSDSQVYSRIYHRLMNEYPDVFSDARLLGTYVRMLVLADKFWPERAPVGRLRASERALVRSGLVTLHVPDGTYSVRGMDAERNARRNAARNAAAVRWGMPSKEEKNIEEKRDGQSPPQTFMGFKHRWRPNLQDIDRQHEESRRQAAERRKQREDQP